MWRHFTTVSFFSMCVFWDIMWSLIWPGATTYTPLHTQLWLCVCCSSVFRAPASSWGFSSRTLHHGRCLSSRGNETASSNGLDWILENGNNVPKFLHSLPMFFPVSRFYVATTDLGCGIQALVYVFFWGCDNLSCGCEDCDSGIILRLGF